jgi:hypothetical protein
VPRVPRWCEAEGSLELEARSCGWYVSRGPQKETRNFEFSAEINRPYGTLLFPPAFPAVRSACLAGRRAACRAKPGARLKGGRYETMARGGGKALEAAREPERKPRFAFNRAWASTRDLARGEDAALKTAALHLNPRRN